MPAGAEGRFVSSKIPRNIRDNKAFIASKRPGTIISIRGSATPNGRNDGRHLGLSDITGQYGKGLWGPDNLDGDFSTKHPRDRDNVTEFAAAFDITLPTKTDRAAFSQFVERGMRDGTLDVCEYGGPFPDGNAYWVWVGRRGRIQKVKLTGKFAEKHMLHGHVGLRRDMVPDADLIEMFVPFFGPRPDPLPPDTPDIPDPDPEPGDEDELLRARIAELEAALATMQTQMDAEKIAHGETRQQLVTAETKLAAAKNAAQSIVAL
jgi:hypothetical protein